MMDEYNVDLTCIVEADETYVGGRRRGSEGRGHKTLVLGAVERGGRVKAQVVKTP
jgi:hypothetical protein